jgi:hypothetical protein
MKDIITRAINGPLFARRMAEQASGGYDDKACSSKGWQKAES